MLLWSKGTVEKSGDLLPNLGYLQSGRYVVLKKIGEGGKGIVYKARDTVLNRVVAIKMLKSAGMTEEAYSRFMREAQAFAKLNHPNVVSIYDIGKEDEGHFFVNEFIDGMSLRDLMGTYPDGRCDIQTVLRIGTDICSALQYAHSQGVLHRDIKPENILISKEGVAKLNDFGLAQMLGQPNITQEGMIVGTVAYVAPEIALGKGADARSDLYSFGAVLYEAIAGRPPFVGQDPVKIIFSHIHDYPVSPGRLNREVPQHLEDCIMKLLEKDPEERHRTAADLLGVLRGISQDFSKENLVPSRKIIPAVPSHRPSALRDLQLVDRVEEMGLLREAVDRAVGGEGGGVVFVHGEAGIGKTRLSRELEAYARLRGMQVLFGRCSTLYRMDGVPPYVLWSEVIKDYLQACTPEQLYKVIGFYPSEVFKLVPEIRQKLAIMPESPPISPEHERDRLFEAVSQFITNISKEAPLLVVLDDLQWTDQSSLLLLHYLARGVSKERLLFLGNYRDTDIDQRHALSSVLTDLNRERLLQSVPLKRMSFNDSSEMIRQILAQDDVPREFCELIYEKTRGNPFFLEEVIKSLKEQELIYREQNRWRIKEVSRIEFPETVKSVVEGRISRLDDECQNALTMASFVGKDFTFEALRGITGLEDDRLLEIIEKMLKTGLIRERLIRGEDVYSFTDIVVRDVVHDEVSVLRHKRLHGKVGAVLEKVYAKNIDDHLGELAYHFLEGGEKDKGLDYFLKAAGKAERIYAYGEAASFFESALKLLEEKEGDLEEKAHVLWSLGEIKGRIGDYDNCMKYWNDASKLYEALDKKDYEPAVRHGHMANYLFTMGEMQKAKEHYEEALKLSLRILESEPAENVELARLYYVMGYWYYMTGDNARAVSCTDKALELAKKLNASYVIAGSYECLGFFDLRDKKRNIECMEKALQTALDNGHMEIAVRVYRNLALGLPAEENERILAYLEKGLELAKKVGVIIYQSAIGAALGFKYLNMGDVNKAVRLLEESVALDRKAGNMTQLPMSLDALGFAYEVLGEWNESEQCYREALGISQKLDAFQSSVTALGFLAWLHLDKGEQAKAKDLSEQVSDLFERAGAKYSPVGPPPSEPFRLILVVWTERARAWTYVELGEIEKAKNLIDGLHDFALEDGNREMMASAGLLRAMMFRAQKKWGESIQLFEKGLQELEALGARRWNGYLLAKMVLYEYARVYLERSQAGDREKAHNLLNQALDIFQKIGAKKDIQKIIAKKNLLTA